MDTSVLNDKKQAPIHLVTELNKVSVLEVMSKYKDRIDIQQGGEHGRTALHIAAIYDHEECARILVSNHIVLNLLQYSKCVMLFHIFCFDSSDEK